jgi:cytochrome b subunit of formate dehydrogenase
LSDGLPEWLRLLGIVCLAAFARAALPAQTEACLACHADRGADVAIAKDDSVGPGVDEQQLKASVHSFLACTDCHDPSLTGKGHEQRRSRSAELDKLRYSSACRRCHHDEQIAGLAVHARLLEQEAAGHAPICTDCHPAHSIQPVAGGHVLAGESSRCGVCHARQAREMATARTPAQGGPLRRNVHGALTCTSCHAGFSRKSHPAGLAAGVPSADARQGLCRPCHADLYAKAREGVHEELRRRGQPGTPECVDCHGSHRTAALSHDRPASAAVCGKCHAKLYATYLASVHGDALVHAENHDVPACIDCHRAHNTGDPRTADYRVEIPFICANCHGNKAIVGKYGLSTDVVRTYLSDFHGSTISAYRELGSRAPRPDQPIAVCTDCHGTHNIKSMATLTSAEVKARLLGKCRQCHADATANFADAWLSHYTPSLSHARALFLVDWAYRILLPLMLLGMVLHVALHARHYVAAPRARGTSAAATARRLEGARVRRFSTGRIVEHLVLIVLVTLLAGTGLAQLFHQAAVAQWFLSAIGGIEVARLVHRCAGAALAALLLVHVAVVAAGISFRGWRLSMVATPQDLRDAIQDVRYGLGLARRPADRGRYDYKEKFTYWLVLIAVTTMTVSGLVLWFPAAATRHLPGEVIPLAVLLHSRQALTVLLLVCAWHVYDAIFSPDVFPMDTSIFTGYTTRARNRPPA